MQRPPSERPGKLVEKRGTLKDFAPGTSRARAGGGVTAPPRCRKAASGCKTVAPCYYGTAPAHAKIASRYVEATSCCPEAASSWTVIASRNIKTASSCRDAASRYIRTSPRGGENASHRHAPASSSINTSCGFSGILCRSVVLLKRSPRKVLHPLYSMVRPLGLIWLISGLNASGQSSRRRDYSRRPLTPRYVRFRIRRFVKDSGF